MALTTELVREAERFDDLRVEWNGLLEHSGSSSLTLTWEWLATWWRVFRDERELRVVLVRDGATLIGAVPLLHRTRLQSRYRVLPYKRYELLASGEAFGHQICSDYIDWIAARGTERAVVAAALRLLCTELSSEWSEILLPDVSADSPALAALQVEARERGLLIEELAREPSPYIRLPSSLEDYLDSVSSGFRYKIRRGRREFEQRRGRYSVVSTLAELGPAFDTFLRLHQARWTARAQPGGFASPLIRRFHEEFSRIALERGWLRLGLLSIADEPIGAIYNFVFDRRVYFYQSGIIPQDSTHLRPGMLLHAFEIEAAIAAGHAEYDFLKRGDASYKDDWCNAARDLVAMRIAYPGMRQELLNSARRVHGLLRRGKRWLRPARPSETA